MYIGNERVTNGQFREAANRAFAHAGMGALWEERLQQAVARIILQGDAPLARDLAILFGRLWETSAPNPAPVRCQAAPTADDDDSLEDDVAEGGDGDGEVGHGG